MLLLMMFLLEQRGADVVITEDAVKVASTVVGGGCGQETA
jgi:hypothetical protein